MKYVLRILALFPAIGVFIATIVVCLDYRNIWTILLALINYFSLGYLLANNESISNNLKKFFKKCIEF